MKKANWLGTFPVKVKVGKKSRNARIIHTWTIKNRQGERLDVHVHKPNEEYFVKITLGAMA